MSGLRTWSVRVAFASAIFGAVCIGSAFLGERVVGLEPILGSGTSRIGKIAFSVAGVALWIHQKSPQEPVELPPPAKSPTSRWRHAFGLCGSLTILLGIVLLVSSCNVGQDSKRVPFAWLAWGSVFAVLSGFRGLLVAGTSISRDTAHWTDVMATLLLTVTILSAMSLLLVPEKTEDLVLRGSPWIPVVVGGSWIGAGAYAIQRARMILSTSRPEPRVDYRRRSPRNHA